MPTLGHFFKNKTPLYELQTTNPNPTFFWVTKKQNFATKIMMILL
jgi:hypothetical protein